VNGAAFLARAAAPPLAGEIQGEPECGSLAGGAGDANLSLVKVDDFFAEIEAQSQVRV